MSAVVEESDAYDEMPLPDAERWARKYREDHGHEAPVWPPSGLGLALTATAVEPTVTSKHTATVEVSATNERDSPLTIRSRGGRPHNVQRLESAGVHLLPPGDWAPVEPGWWRVDANLGQNAPVEDRQFADGTMTTARRTLWRTHDQGGVFRPASSCFSRTTPSPDGAPGDDTPSGEQVQLAWGVVARIEAV